MDCRMYISIFSQKKKVFSDMDMYFPRNVFHVLSFVLSSCSSSSSCSWGLKDPDGERSRLPVLEESGRQRKGLQWEQGESETTIYS